MSQSQQPIEVSVNGRRKLLKVAFGHKWRPRGGQWQEGDIIIDEGTPEHEIIFEVDPASPKALRFVDDPNEAIWVSTGTCPTSQCNKGGQIEPVSVEADGTLLRIRNANSRAVDLHYVLRFKRSVPVLFKPHEYDPVIRNGGGG